jgi:hypothetical protein
MLDVPFDIIKWMVGDIGSTMPYYREEENHNYSDDNGNSTGGLSSQHLELVEQWKQHRGVRKENEQQV